MRDQIDADIIDYPELANTYAGFAILDAEGNGYLSVPIVTPDMANRPGRRTLNEVQKVLRDTLSAWALRAFHTARAAGMSVEDAQAMLAEHATVFSASSARAKGPDACRRVFGVDPDMLAQRLRNIVDDARAKGGEQAVADMVTAAFATVANLSRAFNRSRGYDGRLYDAFYGRTPGTFHDKMANAVNPQPREHHFPLSIAAQLSYLSGVSLSFLWQDQWLYRLPLATAAALHPWTRNEPAELLPEEFYTLFRCVQTADPSDPTEHGFVKCFLAKMVDQHQGREHFLHHTSQALREEGLLPKRPRTVTELMRRVTQIVTPDGKPASFYITPR